MKETQGAEEDPRDAKARRTRQHLSNHEGGSKAHWTAHACRVVRPLQKVRHKGEEHHVLKASVGVATKIDRSLIYCEGCDVTESCTVWALGD
jgi:hypothetical protein